MQPFILKFMSSRQKIIKLNFITLAKAIQLIMLWWDQEKMILDVVINMLIKEHSIK